jgi:hypothetical protein
VKKERRKSLHRKIKDENTSIKSTRQMRARNESTKVDNPKKKKRKPTINEK